MRKWTLYMYIIHAHSQVIPWATKILNLMQHFVDRVKRIAMKQLENLKFSFYFSKWNIRRIWAPKNTPQMIVFLFNWNECRKEIFHPHRFVISHIFSTMQMVFLVCVCVCVRGYWERAFVFRGILLFWFVCVRFACVWVPFLDLFYSLLCRFALKHMGNYFWFKPKGTSNVRTIQKKVENEWEKTKSKSKSESEREREIVIFWKVFMVLLTLYVCICMSMCACMRVCRSLATVSTRL